MEHERHVKRTWSAIVVKSSLLIKPRSSHYLIVSSNIFGHVSTLQSLQHNSTVIIRDIFSKWSSANYGV